MHKDPLTLPVEKTYLIDPLGAAEHIESALINYLIPPKAGIYLPFSTRLLVAFGEQYFRPHSTIPGELESFTPYQEEDVLTDVFDRNGNLLLKFSEWKEWERLFRDDRRIFPIVGFELLRATFDTIIKKRSAWIPAGERADYEDCWNEFLKGSVRQPQHQGADEPRSEDPAFDKAHRILFGILEHFISGLQSFIGPDLNETYVMHFLRVVGTDFHVEKTIDYRIYDWHRIQEAKKQPVVKNREHA